MKCSLCKGTVVVSSHPFFVNAECPVCLDMSSENKLFVCGHHLCCKCFSNVETNESQENEQEVQAPEYLGVHFCNMCEHESGPGEDLSLWGEIWLYDVVQSESFSCFCCPACVVTYG